MRWSPSEAELTTAAPKLRVLVIGAGFGGLSAAKRLAGQGVQVTVIDRDNFHTFQPLLYQVATAGLDVSDVAYPVRAIFRKHRDVWFRHGEVRQVDVDARRVVLGDGSIFHYDELIVATGATAGFFGIAGASQHAHPLYTLADARRVRNLLLRCLEDAEARPKLHDGGAACIVVVGGGATGVETAGAVVELLAASRRADSLELDWDRTRVVLVDSNDRLLSGFHERAGAYALRTLRHRGVDVRLVAPVVEVTDGNIHLGGDHEGEVVRADLVIWAGGVTVDGTLAASMPVQRTKGGRVRVRDDLALEGHPEVSVVGDAAAVPTGRKRRGGRPKTRARSWHRSPYSPAGTRPSRSCADVTDSAPPPSIIWTRARWRRSAAGPPSPS